jgi:hypothetical protein
MRLEYALASYYGLLTIVARHRLARLEQDQLEMRVPSEIAVAAAGADMSHLRSKNK